MDGVLANVYLQFIKMHASEFGKVLSAEEINGRPETVAFPNGKKYVNSPGTSYPRQVSMEYSGVKKPGRGGRSEFINHRPAKGQNADAGHILGNQFGGKGNQNASVFPQHPPTNRGNYHKGKPTRHKWRALEDNIRKSAQSGEEPSVTVTLRDARRVSYKRGCSQCWFLNPIGAVTCVQCGHLL